MLKKNEDFTLIKIDNRFFITAEYIHFEVNETGARIFSLCNGKNTKEEIAKKLSKKFNSDFSDVLNQVEDFIKELFKMNIIKK